MTHIVIIGGGIIGVSSAWYLKQDGWDVTVVDQGKIGAACSGGNCGLVCPSHVLPLTEPGAFKAAVKTLLTPNSPFHIQPRLDPALWSWLWNFAKRCNHDSMVQAAHAIQALLTSGKIEYERWVGQLGIDCEWQEKGLLFVFQHVRELEKYARTNELLTKLFNEPARQLNASETTALEPSIRDDVAGGWFYQHDAHLRPDKLISSLRERLESGGVRFIEDCEFSAIKGRTKSAQSVETKKETLQADAFLFASGAWTPLLKQALGCRIPIEPGKGYSITMPRPTICPTIPLIFPEHRVAVTPMVSGYRLGSIMEFAGYDTSIDPKRLAMLKNGATHYLREPYCDPVVNKWYGWRPMTYDSLPVIDRSPAWDNVWVAAGHNMLGLSMAPATGKLVAELLGGRGPHIDPEPYSLRRF